MITQAAFVLQAPAGNNSGVTNGSASVPFNTTLVFAAGSTLKLQNAVALRAEPGQRPPGRRHRERSGHLHVVQRRQRSAAPPTTTPTPIPHAGDWGGIVFRNYDQAAQPTATFPVDGTLVGLNGADADLRRVRTRCRS